MLCMTSLELHWMRKYQFGRSTTVTSPHTFHLSKRSVLMTSKGVRPRNFPYKALKKRLSAQNLASSSIWNKSNTEAFNLSRAVPRTTEDSLAWSYLLPATLTQLLQGKALDEGANRLCLVIGVWRLTPLAMTGRNTPELHQRASPSLRVSPGAHEGWPRSFLNEVKFQSKWKVSINIYFFF